MPLSNNGQGGQNEKLKGNKPQDLRVLGSALLNVFDAPETDGKIVRRKPDAKNDSNESSEAYIEENSELIDNSDQKKLELRRKNNLLGIFQAADQVDPSVVYVQDDDADDVAEKIQLHLMSSIKSL